LLNQSYTGLMTVLDALALMFYKLRQENPVACCGDELPVDTYVIVE